MDTRDKLLKNIGESGITLLLHLLVLILSIVLIVAISIDTFKNVNFSYEPEFLKLEYWVCVVFLADFFIELAFSKKKWKYIRARFLFFLVSIPYVAIVHQIGIHFPPQVEYVLRFVPLVRGGYALAMVINWMTYNRATGLFLTYLTTLAATVYFVSLTFFVFENGANPSVKSYYDALWWASMNVTTLGSNIIPTTTVGKILGVVLGALGMMIFPVFTVYVTSLIKKQRNYESPDSISKLITEIKEARKGNDKTADGDTDGNAGGDSDGEPQKNSLKAH